MDTSPAEGHEVRLLRFICLACLRGIVLRQECLVFCTGMLHNLRCSDIPCLRHCHYPRCEQLKWAALSSRQGVETVTGYKDWLWELKSLSQLETLIHLPPLMTDDR